MKNIKIIFTFLLVAAFTASCDTDGGESNIDFRVGALPDITQNEDLSTILNFLDLQQGVDSNFGFTLEVAQGNVTSADVVALYRKANGDLYGPVTLESGIITFPSEFTYSTTEIVNAFSELNSLEDLELADQLIISSKLYLQDGTEINMWDENGRLYGSDIHTATIYNASAYYPVGCPLEGSFTGEYRVTSSSPAGPYGPFAPDEFTVTFAESSQTTRTFTLAYLPALGFPPVNPTLEFVCGRVLLQETGAGFGCGGSITFGSADDGVEIDPEDDSGFSMTITDFLSDGGCGVASREVTLTFEKI